MRQCDLNTHWANEGSIHNVEPEAEKRKEFVRNKENIDGLISVIYPLITVNAEYISKYEENM